MIKKPLEVCEQKKEEVQVEDFQGKDKGGKDNTGRESSDSWLGRRRKCSEKRRKSGRSECEEEEQERQEGEQRSRGSFCTQQPGLLTNVMRVQPTLGGFTSGRFSFIETKERFLTGLKTQVIQVLLPMTHLNDSKTKSVNVKEVDFILNNIVSTYLSPFLSSTK